MPRVRIAVAAIRTGARKCTILSARTRHDVFFDQHLDTVGDWLKEAERPDPIRAVAILYPPENLPLQHRHERKEREKHGEQRENVNQARCDLDKPVGAIGNGQE